MRNKIYPYLQIFKSRRITAVTILGFMSGLPLALSSGTLQAWFTVLGIDIKIIGILTIIGLPYTLKFLWAPLMDRFIPPILGRRRGWILITQILIIVGITSLAYSAPDRTIFFAIFLATFVAFTSASQDIVIDAYRTDILHEKERGLGAAVFVMGYRIALLVSGALALIMADRIGWENTYLTMAFIMLCGLLITLFGTVPEEKISPPSSMKEAILGPLKDYFKRDSSIILLLLIILYKLGDAYAASLTTPFLIRGLGFTPTDVGTINKGLGFVSLITGATIGGTLMVRFGLYQSLIYFGILQALSNLSFVLLALTGKNYSMFIFTIAFENFSGGMGTSAFVSLLMAMCNHKYSATQYALLSSISAFSRTFISPTSGFVVEKIGWAGFFLLTFLTALPGLILLLKLKKTIYKIETTS